MIKNSQKREGHSGRNRGTRELKYPKYGMTGRERMAYDETYSHAQVKSKNPVSKKLGCYPEAIKKDSRFKISCILKRPLTV